MVRFDARHHGDFGPVAEIPTIVLVRFADHGALARAGAMTIRGSVGADERQRVQTALIEQPRDDGGRGGLAVGARDGHAAATVHQLANGLGELPVRQSSAGRFDDFGVGQWNRGRADDVVRVVWEVPRAVADGDGRTARNQLVQHGVRREVAAAHLLAHVQEETGQGGHARAANADHVDAAGPLNIALS